MSVDVLLVDDDAAVREALAQSLDLAELATLQAASFVEAKDHIRADFPGVILSDIRMPGRDGFHLLRHAGQVDADLPVILLTGEGDIPMAVDAMGQGAFGFLEKPCAAEELVTVLRRALETRRLVLENRRLKAQLETGDPAARLLHGTSDLSDRLRARVRSVARMAVEVLVSGPPGAGVSKVAEVIHLMSPQARGPFVKRQGAALDGEGLASALEAAKGGTLFIDDASGLPGPQQYDLLERLEQGMQARLIAGSTVELREEAEAGRFNAELYYRLDVTPVRIPPLSERPEDIPVLFSHYVAQAAEQAGLPEPDISNAQMARLMAQDWPGNTRALMSAAMRFVLGVTEPGEEAELGLAEQMARVERSLLVAALSRQNGRAGEAAKALKLPRKTFYDKLARYGIRPEDYRR
jgi:two-component system C4-dicarboxylate transport response regulator DctD